MAGLVAGGAATSELWLPIVASVLGGALGKSAGGKNGGGGGTPLPPMPGQAMSQGGGGSVLKPGSQKPSDVAALLASTFAKQNMPMSESPSPPWSSFDPRDYGI